MDNYINIKIPDSLIMKNDILYHYFDITNEIELNKTDSIIIRNNIYNNFQIDLKNYLQKFPQIGNYTLLKLNTIFGNSTIGNKNTTIYIFIDIDLSVYTNFSNKFFSIDNLFINSDGVLNFKIISYINKSVYFRFDQKLYQSNILISKSSNNLQINNNLSNNDSIITYVYKENNYYNFGFVKL